MKIIKTGINFIAEAEGLELNAYKDEGGTWTIGYGHTKTARPGMMITEEQARDLLAADLADAEKAVNELVTVDLTPNQYSALVSFVFNVGIDAFKKSRLLKLLNKGRYDAIPGQLRRWIYCKGKVSKGLIKRRDKEIDLWYLDAPQSPKKGKRLARSTTAAGAAASSVAVMVASSKEVLSVFKDGGLSFSWSTVVLVIAVLGLCGALWVIKERIRHADEYGI